MVISFEIDTKILKTLDINLSQLLFLTIVYNGGKRNITEVIKHNLIKQNEFDELISKEILDKTSNLDQPESIELTTAFEEEFKKISLDYFDEFLEVYPSSVIRPDGTKGFTKNNPKKCRQIYKTIVGNNKDKHKHLIDCLNAELEDRMLSNNMAYLKTMSNWLSQEGWLHGEELLKDRNTENIYTGYGSTIE